MSPPLPPPLTGFHGKGVSGNSPPAPGNNIIIPSHHPLPPTQIGLQRGSPSWCLTTIFPAAASAKPNKVCSVLTGESGGFTFPPLPKSSQPPAPSHAESHFPILTRPAFRGPHLSFLPLCSKGNSRWSNFPSYYRTSPAVPTPKSHAPGPTDGLSFPGGESQPPVAPSFWGVGVPLHRV